ncbi:MAG: hypothetical protein ACT4NP_02250 [Pseudonocardiales bacterium]
MSDTETRNAKLPERILALQAWLVAILLLNVWRNHTRATVRRPAQRDLATVTERIDPRTDVAEVIRSSPCQHCRPVAAVAVAVQETS